MTNVVDFRTYDNRIITVPYTLCDEGVSITLDTGVTLLLSPLNEKFIFKGKTTLITSKILEDEL